MPHSDRTVTALRREKLLFLIECSGLDSQEDFLEAFALESVVPGVCMNKDCGATYEYEPDQNRGWCEVCGTNSVVSGLILIGII
jgi:hypothetical protein